MASHYNSLFYDKQIKPPDDFCKTKNKNKIWNYFSDLTQCLCSQQKNCPIDIKLTLFSEDLFFLFKKCIFH